MNQYSRIELTTNKYISEGVPIGSLGYVLEIYPDGAMEVEFSDADGINIAQLVLQTSDLKISLEANL